MCRALVVVCAAPDRDALLELKRSAVGSEWELSPGATSAEAALAEIEDRRAHALVVSGPPGDLVSRARARWPGLRIVVVGPLPGPPEASTMVGSLGEVREAVRGLPSPGGPVRT